jgi:hypothetical protein
VLQPSRRFPRLGAQSVNHATHKPRHSIWSSTVGAVAGDETVSVEAEAVALGRFLREVGVEHVDFVKIDVEGAEAAVLDRTDEVLKQGEPRAIMCELTLPSGAKGCGDRLGWWLPWISSVLDRSRGLLRPTSTESHLQAPGRLNVVLPA